MAIAATFTPRGLQRPLWPQLDSEGNAEEAEPLSYDPLLEQLRRSTPIEIGPRKPTDLAKVANINNASIVEAIKTRESDLPGGRQYIQHSERKRTVELIAEDGDVLTITVSGNTRVYQVHELVATFLTLDAAQSGNLAFVGNVGNAWKAQFFNDEVASKVKVRGVKTFGRPRKEYKHPILILGTGIGGIGTAMKLLQKGRTNIQLVEKLHDFGGASWYYIANKTTKLQTEAATYHLQYYFDWLKLPQLPTWPSRDHVIAHFQMCARQFGLEKYTKFNTKITKITPKGEGYGADRWYLVHHEPADGSGEMEAMQVGAAILWPGNLSINKEDVYPGEDEFGGYIEYASLNKPKFVEVSGKDTVIVGHGAFAIENVRTALEFDCHKIYVVCRRRNITAPKVISWMVGSMSRPMPGNIMMDAIGQAYKLLGWDPWNAYSVTTDEAHSFARIDQGTMFGVTDVYFVAGYYGIMDVIVGDVARLTHHCVHLKGGRRVRCEALLKTVGVRGDKATDRMMGLKELVGFWVNGDPLMPCISNTLFVQASNFASYSIAPAIASEAEAVVWFIDFPQDFEIVRASLPVHNKDNTPIKGNSLYVYSAAHATMTSMVLMMVPGLMEISSLASSLKQRKQREIHPYSAFVTECEAEWQMYVEMCQQHPAARQDRPPPPFPYSREMLAKILRDSGDPWMS